MVGNFVVYTPSGFVAEGNADGSLRHTRKIEDAALWPNTSSARYVASRVNGCVLTARGELLTIAECYS